MRHGVCLFESVYIPFTSVSGFLETSTGFNVSNRGAIVRQLVGRPAGKKPVQVHTSVTSQESEHVNYIAICHYGHSRQLKHISTIFPHNYVLFCPKIVHCFSEKNLW